MDGTEKYNKIYDDCKEILSGEKFLDSFSTNKAPQPTDLQLEKFRDYARQFIDDTDRGSLRTILVIGKPFKNNIIVKDVLSELADKLRIGSHNGII